MVTARTARLAGMPPRSYDDRADLAHFRSEIVGPLTLVPAAAAIALLYVAADGYRFETWLPMLGFALTAVICHQVRRYGDDVSAVCLTIGLLLALTSLVHVFPGYSLACTFAAVVAIASLSVGPRFGLLAALTASLIVLHAYGVSSAIAADVAYTAIGMVWAIAILFLLTTRPVFVALDWAWSSYLDGLHTAEQLRDRQAELGRLSKSLQETCIRLENLNQELERARLAAEEARQLKNEFVAAVSHELRTPLNLIIGFSEMMVLSPDDSYGEPLPIGYRTDVEAIYRSACHISNLIDDILDLSQIDTHRMALHKEMASLTSLVDGVIAGVASLFRDKSLQLDVELPEDLPSLYVDPTRVRQVLINLLANAARCTDRGGVTVSAARRGNEVVVAVTDTGVGMAPEDVPRAFETFRQVGEQRGRRAGHGLGLAVSKRFVEMHGGAMWAESRLGEGTSFYLSLPLHQAVVIPDDAPPWEAWMGAQRANKENAILALDEEGRGSRILERYLEGYQVVRAADVAEAQQLVAGGSIRAVVLTSGYRQPDVRSGRPSLPHFDGIPTIVCPFQMSRTEADELQVADYLVKPVSSAQLRAALRRLGREVRSVLVVDDDPHIVRLLGRMVRSIRRSCRVWEASDGRAGLQLLRTRQPDVVLLDLLMPGVDGYGFLEAMQGDTSLGKTPVIVISAQGREREAIVATSMSVLRSGGFTIGEATRCLKATLDVLLAPATRSSSPERPGGLLG